jgi:hypothetical protein
MDFDSTRRGSRDNGLRCANYTPVADLDPRIVDALLSTLRDEGIAAYATPTPAATGGAMEVRLPSRPIDRLWVDDTQVARAKDLVQRESSQRDDRAESLPVDNDFESAWQQVLASLQSTPGPATPSWPEDEPGSSDAGAGEAGSDDLGDEDSFGDSYDPADVDHFEPPPPPPLPRPRKVTIGAWAAIVMGLLILITNLDGGSFTVVAILTILGGVVSLVWHMRQGPPTDSGWDDGAVV